MTKITKSKPGAVHSCLWHAMQRSSRGERSSRKVLVQPGNLSTNLFGLWRHLVTSSSFSFDFLNSLFVLSNEVNKAHYCDWYLAILNWEFISVNCIILTARAFLSGRSQPPLSLRFLCLCQMACWAQSPPSKSPIYAALISCSPQISTWNVHFAWIRFEMTVSSALNELLECLPSDGRCKSDCCRPVRCRTAPAHWRLSTRFPPAAIPLIAHHSLCRPFH